MTALTADVTDLDTLFPTNEMAPSPGAYYTIGDEAVQLLGAAIGRGQSDDRTSWLVERGIGGTTPAAHSSGATLTRYYPDAATLPTIDDGPQVVTAIPAVFRVTAEVDGEVQFPFEVGPDRANFDVGALGTVSITRTAFDGAQIYLMSGGDSLVYMQNDNGDVAMYTKFNALTQLRPIIIQTAAPADADLSAGQVALWFDATNGAAKLKIKGKSANGTVVVGEVALT